MKLWSVPGVAAIVVAVVLTLSFLLALSGGTRKLPDYLQPYAPYFIHESFSRRFWQRLIGCIAYLVSLVFFALTMIGSDNTRRPSLENVLLGFALILVCAPLFWVFLSLGQMLFSRAATTALKHNSKPRILYLRSFVADAHWFDRWRDLFVMLVLPGRTETAEYSLTKAVKDLGPMIAIGRPGEMLPPMGAARMYVQHEQWQAVVEALVHHSQLVILRTGITDSFWWEMQHVAKSCDPQRILIFLPPKDRREVYQVLRARALNVLPHPLPEHPGDAYFVKFDADWTPRLQPWPGPRVMSLIRQFIIGSPSPIIRDGLRATLWQLKLPTGGLPLQGREWFLISLPLILILSLVGVFVWILYFS